MKTSPAILALLISTACATVGTKIDTSLVNNLQIGVSTKEDAIKLFGPPTTTSISNNLTILVWSYAHAVTFGGAESTVVQLWFDSNGKLSNKTVSGTNIKHS